jgi:hypothetical protein
MSDNNYQAQIDILENLESQLNGFKLEAAKLGLTDIALMIHKFRQQTKERLYDAQADVLKETV